MDDICEKIREQIPELIGAGLSAEKAAELEQHRSQCPTCNEYFEALQTDDKLLCEFAEAMQPRIARLERNTANALNRMPLRKSDTFIRTWPRIVKNPIAKLAVAAVVLVAILLLIHNLIGSIDGSTFALAKTLERMRQSAWVHSVTETHSERGKTIWHAWRSSDPHVNIRKSQEGTVLYTAYSQNVRNEYNPNSNAITVSFASNDHLLPRPEGPFESIARIVESARQRDGKITRQLTNIDGIRVEAIRIVYSNDPQTESVVLVRDIKTDLLTKMERKGIWRGRNGRFTSMTTFEYPEHGPKDIYTLGVPRDAKIVDIRPEGPAMALVELIDGRFKRGFGDHIAVVLHSWVEEDGSLEPGSIAVMRQKGDLKRVDRYHAYNFQNREPRPGTLYEDMRDTWPNLTIPQMLELEDSEALERQILFDGKQTITRHRDFDGVWKDRRADRIDYFKTRMEDSLAGLTWTVPYGQITSGSSHMKVDIQLLSKDPNHPGLVGFKFLKFAQSDEYWFDPDKDHILIEHIDRQKGSRPLSKTVVAETDRTPDGKWYPKLIRFNSTSLSSQGLLRSQSWEKRVLLDTNPSFTEGMFDASSLVE